MLLLLPMAGNSNTFSDSKKKWHIRIPRAWDKDWLVYSGQLVSMLVVLQDALKIGIKLVKTLPWLLVPLCVVAERLWIFRITATNHPQQSFLVWNCCQHVIYWYIPTKSLASIIRPSMEDRMWRFLSGVIAFTAHTTTTTASNTRWIPSLIRVAILLLILATVATWRCNDRSWEYSDNHDPGQAFSSGFSAKIPSCYDGDTCHLQDLAYNNQLLPPLFQQMNVRIKGIDAPERSRGGCPLERCLAELSLKVVEDIIQVGNGERLELQNCQHDKYGKRLLCDVYASPLSRFDTTSTNVAAQLVATSPFLAVPYFGKTKTSPWCSETFQRQHQNDLYLQECESWKYINIY